jgi:hypothetical protein
MWNEGRVKRSRSSLLLAVWLALQLLLAQQFAFAHMVGHVGEALAVHAGHAAADAGDEDREHGGAGALTHVCLGCAAGLAPGVTAAGQSIPLPRCDDLRVALLAVSPAPTFNALHTYFSRAPPRLQD